MFGAARKDPNRDGAGDGVYDEDDLAVATAAFWLEEPVGAGHALPNSDEEDTPVWRDYHKDHLGGNTTVTDSQGDVVSTLCYHPWDKTAQRTGVKPVYGFAGGEIEEEEELGLIQFGARWYAPEIGRWVSADPLFFEHCEIGKQLAKDRIPLGRPMSPLYNESFFLMLKG